MRFRFRPIPFVVTVLLVALGISLAHWQERRAAGKLALQAVLERRSHEAPVDIGAAQAYSPVRVTGTYLRDWAVYLDNRPYKGQAGLYVLMPLQLADGSVVLVARGWLPRDPVQRERIAPYATPAGVVTVEGVAQASIGHVLQLGEAASAKPGAILQNIDTTAFARASGLRTAPLIVEQTGAAADTLVRDWPPPALGVEKHRGYAFQWYALAIMAALFFVITGFRSGKSQTK